MRGLVFACLIGSKVLSAQPDLLYLDLLKQVLVNSVYEDPNWLGEAMDAENRENGLEYPLTAHTMMGMKRLDNIHHCMARIFEEGVPGDCVEAGVWRGGGTIFMRGVLKAYGIEDRKVWVADSFNGYPYPNGVLYEADLGLDLSDNRFFAVSLEKVKHNFTKYGLLDNKLEFLEGLFSSTLATAPIDQISLLRLDGFLYESTMDALMHLYPKLSIGGYVIVDDY